MAIYIFRGCVLHIPEKAVKLRDDGRFIGCLFQKSPGESYGKTGRLGGLAGQRFETVSPAGVQRAQLFVLGYRECNPLCGSRAAVLPNSVASRHLVLGITWRINEAGRQQAALFLKKC